MQATTQLIHSIPVDPATGSIAVPIYQTSTFVQEAPGVNKGYDYARTGNPTRATLEDLVAHLEGGSTGAAFASGLAAIDAVVKLLESGDEIVAVDDIYGGAYRLFEQVYRKFGITTRYVDTTNPEAVFHALTPKTRLICGFGRSASTSNTLVSFSRAMFNARLTLVKVFPSPGSALATMMTWPLGTR